MLYGMRKHCSAMLLKGLGKTKTFPKVLLRSFLLQEALTFRSKEERVD